MKVYKPVSDREIARRLGVTSIHSAYYYLPTIQEIFDLGLVICERADRPQGEWVDAKNAGWKCTVCGKWSNGQYDYCPNCGARMRPKLQGTHFDSIIIDECAMKGADDD